MKTRMILSLGLSALVMGGTMVGCTATQGGLASAGTREAAVSAKLAARDADRASKALAKGNANQAVASAESAVALMPQNANYRALLGQGYLKAGRFDSARTAYSEALVLTSQDGRIALNLTLSQIALGDWRAARETLAAHESTIPAADRGLAFALAGDPAKGVEMLTQVVRSGGGTPKNRQNLALALALSGQWQMARVVASADMVPAQVDARLEQWAAFAKPASASDQVASLLGVRAAQDPGRPVSLALVAAVGPGQVVEHAEAAAAVTLPANASAMEVAEAALAALPTPQATPEDIRIATRALAPVAAPKPVPTIRADVRALKIAMKRVAATAPTGGQWFVQIGAFRNAAVSQDGWRHATRRMPALANRIPNNARFAVKGGSVYRLAFGGFARNEADQICRRYRATGGACFVRVGAGDRVASWAANPVQLASR